jgi:glycosyltransferase involved in cell wall biosynthesis
MNLFTAIDKYTGYGITGYNTFNSLFDIDPELTLFCVSHPNIEDNWDSQKLKISIDRQNNFNRKAPCYKVWQQHDLFTRTVGDSKYGALSFFEIDKVLPKEKAGYSLLDTIFVPSSWAKDILINNGIKNEIVVCPQGVDTNIFNNTNTPTDKPNTYTFVNIGKWELRKGHDILVEIFNNAFDENDDVELWMINHNPFLNADQHKWWEKFYKNTKLGNKIRTFPRLPTQQDLAKVLSYTDCGVFPSRAEGWNNEAIEMLAMDKPIIITNYSAHTQYCNKDNAYLIDIKETEPADDNIWFHGDGNWASIGLPQINQASEYMRYVYTNNIRNNPNGLKTAQDHSWANTANIVYEHMNK